MADTSPLFYLLSIGQIDLLPELFGKIFVPVAVYNELTHPTAPTQLRQWANKRPDWLEISSVAHVYDKVLSTLAGLGERDAILLAMSLHADLILIDERKATKAALNKGFDVTGTLGILRVAAQRNLVDLADCFERLKKTNFRYRQRNPGRATCRTTRAIEQIRLTPQTIFRTFSSTIPRTLSSPTKILYHRRQIALHRHIRIVHGNRQPPAALK